MSFDFGVLGGLFKTVGNVIDDLHTSTEEKMMAQAALNAAQAQIFSQVLDYEAKLVDAKQKVIVAEAQGQSWLQRNWRPMLMTMFGAMIANNFILFPYAAAMGAPVEVLELPEGAWTLLTVGVGGYIAGRSGEKIVANLKKD